MKKKILTLTTSIMMLMSLSACQYESQVTNKKVDKKVEEKVNAIGLTAGGDSNTGGTKPTKTTLDAIPIGNVGIIAEIPHVDIGAVDVVDGIQVVDFVGHLSIAEKEFLAAKANVEITDEAVKSDLINIIAE